MQKTRTFFVVLTLIVLAACGYAFYIGGSPFEAKKEQQDILGASDISQLYSLIFTAANKLKTIPATLEEVDGYNDLELNNNRSEYIYKKTSDKTYELCSMFLTDSRDKYSRRPYEAQPIGYVDLNIHPKGLACFKYDWEPPKSIYDMPEQPVPYYKY